MAANYIGASGTMVGSTLESLGFYYQSFILDSLLGALTGPVAVAVYMIAAIAAMVKYVIEGRGKLLLWFLIGPALFLAVIHQRTETFGADWKFGKKERNRKYVDKVLEASMRDTDISTNPIITAAKISSLFGIYDRMVSAIVQEMIAAITDERERLDMKFLMRAELLGVLHGASVDDPNFSELLQGSFFHGCHNVVEYGIGLRDPRRSFTERMNERDKFLKAFESRVELTANARNFVADIRLTSPALYTIALDQDSNAVGNWLAANETAATTPGAPPDATTYRANLAAARDQLPASFSCKQLWNFTFVGLYRTAKRFGKSVLVQGKRNGLNGDELLNDLLQAKGFDDAALLASGTSASAVGIDIFYRLIAQHLFRNEMANRNTAAFLNDYTSRGFSVPLYEYPAESDLSFMQRHSLANSEWESKTKISTVATNLPYYQGVVLYFLAVGFPFFALLLLIPGRHSGFLMWFFLWMWAKSWDVGFAVVMLLDDILFSLMSVGYSERGKTSGLLLDGDLTTTLYSMKHLDPTFQLGTYYTVISVALESIPIVSSYLIFGSLKGGAGLIAAGMSGFYAPLSKKGALVEGQGMILGSHFDAYERQLQTARWFMQNDNDGMLRYAQTTVSPPFPPRTFMRYPDVSEGYRGESNDTLKGVAKGTAPRLGSLAGMRDPGASEINQFTLLHPFEMGSALIKSLVSRGIGTPAAVLAEVEGARLTALNNIHEARLGIPAGEAGFRTFATHEVLQGASVTQGAYGGLRIPWTQREGYQGKELEYEITRFQEETKMSVASLQGLASGASRLGGPFGTIAAGIMGAGVISTVTQRQPPALGNVRGGPMGVPVTGGRVNSGFGLRRRIHGAVGVHEGIDLDAAEGTRISAARGGTVIFTGWVGGYGNTVILDHGNNTYTLYGHIMRGGISVAEGDVVRQGDQIALSGATGRVTGPNVHFEVIEGHYRTGFYRVDPMPYLGGAASGAPARPMFGAIADGLSAYSRRREQAGR